MPAVLTTELSSFSFDTSYSKPVSMYGFAPRAAIHHLVVSNLGRVKRLPLTRPGSFRDSMLAAYVAAYLTDAS